MAGPRLDGPGPSPSGTTGATTVVSSGSLTSTAIVTGGGTTTLQTPSATSTLSAAGAMNIAGAFSIGGNVVLDRSAAILRVGIDSGLSTLQLYSDGALRMTLLNTGVIGFGGATASFPALKRVTTGLQIRLADDSADTSIVASVHVAGGTVPAVSSGTMNAASKNHAGTIISLTIGAYTGIITFTFTAPTGWRVMAINQTSGAVVVQSASSTTTATITGTTTSGDVLGYIAFPY